MIASLRGNVIRKDHRSAIIECNGVGYLVYMPIETLSNLTVGKEATIHTHLSVRENALDLYGFNSLEELQFFALLNTISGIGPKTALGVLNAATVGSIKKAVTTGDSAHLVKLSGIGTKLANKIVLELKDKLGPEESSEMNLGEEVDALEALKSLGYSHKDAREALKQVGEQNTVSDNSKTSKTSEKVKRALKILAK